MTLQRMLRKSSAVNNMANTLHIPVLLEEVLSFVDSKKSYVVLDMTLGRGGHAEEILKKIPSNSHYYGVDRDRQAIEYCQQNLKTDRNIELCLIRTNFSKAVDIVREYGEKGADFILMDIGVSSPQFDDPSRGFSYRFDSKLDMRMNRDDLISCYDIINSYTEEELVKIFSEYGQCHNARRVSKEIVEKRKEKKIETTFELVDIIKDVLPKKELNAEGHPCKQYFLALRYAVNNELDELKKGVEKAVNFLNKNGRLAVISFNFLEDKIVKNTFSPYISKKKVDKYKREEKEDTFHYLTKKPIVALDEEIKRNPRSRSAIMRVIERS